MHAAAVSDRPAMRRRRDNHRLPYTAVRGSLWRFVTIGSSGVVTLPTGMIDGVIIGLRTPLHVEEQVRSWVGQVSCGIELMRVVHRPNSFELEIVLA
jgi:hypothetical protein